MPSSAPGTWFTAQHPPPIRTLQRLHGMRRLGCLPQILHRPLFPRERALATGCPFCGDPRVAASGVCSGPAPESAPMSGCGCRWSNSRRPSGNCRFVASGADVWTNLTIFAWLLSRMSSGSPCGNGVFNPPGRISSMCLSIMAFSGWGDG